MTEVLSDLAKLRALTESMSNLAACLSVAGAMSWAYWEGWSDGYGVH